jgi:ABC-2 type transport system ATP-binding protein
MKSSVPGAADTSAGRDAAVAVRTLIEQLDAELHHPELARPLSSLAVRGVTLATGWSLTVWRDHVEQWCTTMERPAADAEAALRPAAGEWVERLRKLSSFLATAGREARHIDDDAAADPQARALFGDAGQGAVAAAVEWFAALDGGGTANRAETAAVVVTDLTKRYGTITAVDGVSLTIPRGQIFGLLGPNSAGKTTLIECVEGIRTADSGSVTVLGLRHRDAAKEIKTRTGVQLQRTGFYDLLTLRETLDLYASFYPRPLDVGELMARLQIQDMARTRVKDLSGGILQRMSLGVALVNDPELIFLDEPTTGLDPLARRVIWEAVRSLAEEGRTVVLTTHYMDEAEQLCDRVAIMTAGQIRTQGSPTELIRRYVGESVVEIASGEGFDDAAARALPGVRRHVRQGERLLIQADDPAGLLRAVLAMPRPPADARIRRGTLEDVFLTIAEQESQP